jgi:hypothetical protein
MKQSSSKAAIVARPRTRGILARIPSSRAGVQGRLRLASAKPRLYTLNVFLISGNYTDAFARKNRVVSRTIQIRGDQTLQDLHRAIFRAYGRWEEHCYEFQFGKRPMDPKGERYVLPMAFEVALSEGKPKAGRVDLTTIESLGLKVGQRFGYWFDFGDDWWHQINVAKISNKVPSGRFPRVIKRRGQNPPQYPPLEEEEEE